MENGLFWPIYIDGGSNNMFCLCYQIMHFINVGHDQINRSLTNLTRSNNNRVHNVYCWQVYLLIQVICPCQFSLKHEGCICFTLWWNDTCTVYLKRQDTYDYQGSHSNAVPRGTTNIPLQMDKDYIFPSNALSALCMCANDMRITII